MSDAPNIISTNMETFREDVIQQSMIRPVVVDFWAEWCGPCRQLIPLLEKLTNEANGAFCLVKVNVDECPEIAGAFGVQSIPFVVAMVDGQPATHFAGVQTEPQLREWLKGFMPSASMEAFTQGQQHETDGSVELAEASYRKAAELEPDIAEFRIAHARVLIELNRDPISRALSVYTDAEFKLGENIIDNWSLMHACYFHSDSLKFTAAHSNLAPGQSLATLSAAPYRAEIWQTADGATHLINLVRESRSSLVRVWAMELLQRDHQQAISQIDMKILVSLLKHTDARVQDFASQLFRDHQGLASMTVSAWLEVVEQSDRSLLPMICEAMTKHVATARLDNPQLLLLATAEPVPVAALGLRMLQERHQQRGLNPAEVVQLSRAQCAATAEEMTTWALRQLDSDENYSVDSVVEFFDGLLEPMRAAAITWLEDSSSHGHDDAVLWSRLIETPFDDVRLRLVDCLQHRTTLPDVDVNSLSHLWCSVLLGVHRGGRMKLKAMQQIQAAILRDSRHATKLLPVLSVAARSLRAPERRGAIAAMASLKNGNPELEAAIRFHLPELQWSDC